MAAITDFAHKVGLVLKACNLSRGQLAQAVGIDKSVVSRWASGVQAPTDHNLTLLTEAVGRHRPGFGRVDWELASRDFAERLGLADGASAGEAGLALPGRPSIAVLPFTNMSGDPEQEYFVDGMVEEITTALSRLRWLFVIARNSSFTYKGKGVNVKQVGRDLGVRYVLEGSVRMAANRVRVTAQLIDAGSGAHLWADKFDATLEDIFDLHDQVAREVAGAVEPNLREAEIERSLRKPTTSLDAYDLYMRGLVAFRNLSPESLRVTMELTRRAIELDPHFARALALRGLVHPAPAGGQGGRSRSKGRGVEAGACRPRRVHRRLGSREHRRHRDLLDGRQHRDGSVGIAARPHAQSQRLPGAPAQRMDPVHRRNPAAAIDPFTRALRLSPRDPFLGFCEAGLAVAWRDIGRPQEALVWARRAVMSLPLLASGYRTAAVALVDLGRIGEARERIAQLLKARPQDRIRLDFVRRHNRNAATADAWIAALRVAGLPD